MAIILILQVHNYPNVLEKVYWLPLQWKWKNENSMLIFCILIHFFKYAYFQKFPQGKDI